MLALFAKWIDAIVAILWGLIIGGLVLGYRRGERKLAERRMRHLEDMERLAEELAQHGNDPEAARRFLKEYSEKGVDGS